MVNGESKVEDGCGFVFGPAVKDYPTLGTTWVYELNPLDRSSEI